MDVRQLHLQLPTAISSRKMCHILSYKWCKEMLVARLAIGIDRYIGLPIYLAIPIPIYRYRQTGYRYRPYRYLYLYRLLWISVISVSAKYRLKYMYIGHNIGIYRPKYKLSVKYRSKWKYRYRWPICWC